uniref:Uncharacterized protein n=1 Tax=Arundo donax TaxID=35708 RepID=A0A0A9F683_ARUDO
MLGRGEARGDGFLGSTASQSHGEARRGRIHRGGWPEGGGLDDGVLGDSGVAVGRLQNPTSWTGKLRSKVLREARHDVAPLCVRGIGQGLTVLGEDDGEEEKGPTTRRMKDSSIPLIHDGRGKIMVINSFSALKGIHLGVQLGVEAMELAWQQARARARQWRKRRGNREREGERSG